MTDFDSQVFVWEYRASTRGAHHYDSLMELLPQPCGHVLDAGCGAGRLTMQLATHAQSVTGLDLSERMLALARKRHAAARLPNVTWMRGDVCCLPFASAAFDCVVSTSVLHLVDPEKAVPELGRVAKPGGRLLLQEVAAPAPGWRDEIAAYRFALGASLKALATHGVRPAWQVAVRLWQARLGTNSVAYASQTRISLSRLYAVCSRYLPGWQLEQAPGVLILWDRP